MRNILTTKQVAEELGVTVGTVYGYINNKTLKAHKIGGYTKRRHWRVKVVDLDSFINDGGAEQNTLVQVRKNQGQVAVPAPHFLEEK